MLLATVAAIAVLSYAASGQTLPQGVQKGPSMGGIAEYDFPNGLTVLLYPDQANPKVTIDLTYTVGSPRRFRRNCSSAAATAQR